MKRKLIVHLEFFFKKHITLMCDVWEFYVPYEIRYFLKIKTFSLLSLRFRCECKKASMSSSCQKINVHEIIHFHSFIHAMSVLLLDCYLNE